MTRWPNTVAVGSFVADVDRAGGPGFRVTASLVGWTDAAPVKGSLEERSQQDGGFDGPLLKGARLITMSGFVEGGDPVDAMRVADELQALLPREAYEFVVDNAAVGIRTAMVRVTTGVAIDWDGDEAFTYTITFRAADPLKYGPAWFDSTTLSGSAAGSGRVWPRVWPRDWGVPAGVTPGSVAVPNAGNAPYWPRLRIDGPVENPVVQCVETGDRITVNAAIPAGGWIDVDCGERHVTYGANADDLENLTDWSGTWLAIPPGGASLSYSADTADASAVLHVQGVEGAWH